MLKTYVETVQLQLAECDASTRRHPRDQDEGRGEKGMRVSIATPDWSSCGAILSQPIEQGLFLLC